MKDYIQRLGIGVLIPIIVMFMTIGFVWLISPDMVPHHLSHEGVYGDYKPKSSFSISVLPGVLVILMAYLFFLFRKFNFLFLNPFPRQTLKIISMIVGMPMPKNMEETDLFLKRYIVSMVLLFLWVYAVLHPLVRLIFALELENGLLLINVIFGAIIISAIPLLRFFIRRQK